MYRVSRFTEVLPTMLHIKRVLQAALGELAFESEAADRLRSELRSATRQVAQLEQQLQDAAGKLQAAEEAAAQARQLASDASLGSEEQRTAEKQLQVLLQHLKMYVV